VRLAQWPAAPAGTYPRSLAVRRDALYFTVDDGVHGRELWKTDGTAAGTALADDINPGPAGSDPASLAVADDDTLFFAATDPVHGRELWKVAAPLSPEVYVRGAGWLAVFKPHLQALGLGDAVYGYRLDDKPDSQVLPWINLDELVVRFPGQGRDVAFTASLEADRAGGGVPLGQPVKLDADTWLFHLDRPLGTLAAGGENGVRFNLSVSRAGVSSAHRFNVLQCDVDRSGAVVAADFAAVKRRFFRTSSVPGPAGETQYTIFHDVDGSGTIIASDFAAVKRRFFDNFLPAAAAKKSEKDAGASSLLATTPGL
jgi:ELWxxDGT repeat protein